MYETISGEKITGMIIYRYKRIMTVAGDDGKNYVCWLVGVPDPEISFSRVPLTKNYEESWVTCRAIYPNGTIKDFLSMRGAADHFRTHQSVVSNAINSGKCISRGRLKGMRFERLSK